MTPEEKEYAELNRELIWRGVSVPREMLVTWGTDSSAVVAAKAAALRPMLEAARERQERNVRDAQAIQAGNNEAKP